MDSAIKTRIKICGLRRPEDIEAANLLKPDLIGFVFYEKSKRFVSFETAKALRQQLSPDIQAVGVFVNAPVEKIVRVTEAGIIDRIQLHGQEDDNYIETLRALTDRTVIRAFILGQEEWQSDELLRIEKSAADYVLVDSGAGSGRTLDWSRLKEIRRPYFLAGGLAPDNVAGAIAQLHPYGVDVSSGVETDGIKDREKMAAFIAAVKDR